MYVYVAVEVHHTEMGSVHSDPLGTFATKERAFQEIMATGDVDSNAANPDDWSWPHRQWLNHEYAIYELLVQK